LAVAFFAVDFRAGAFLATDLRAGAFLVARFADDVFFADDVLAVDFLAVVFLAVDFFAGDFLAMQSGIVHGYVALVDGLVDRLAEELGGKHTIIATGGLATLISPMSRTIEHVEHDLTLVGLRILYERNLA
jgi:hypothetical protein